MGGNITGFTGDKNLYVSTDDYICNQSGEDIKLLDIGVDFWGKVNFPFIVSLKDKGSLFLSFYMTVSSVSDRTVAGNLTLTVKGYTGDVETNSYTRTFTPYETLSLMFYANKKLGYDKENIITEDPY